MELSKGSRVRRMIAGHEEMVTSLTVFSSLFRVSWVGFKMLIISWGSADQGTSLLMGWEWMNCFQVGRSIVMIEEEI